MITVNAMGDNCPIPVIKTKKAMDALTGPETIEVLVDNEIAVQNVTKMATSCLLYTSDAADEEDSVDLGGRRIIQKKKNREREKD